MKKPEESNFCYYPFMQILLTSDGKYRPCSKHQDYITHQGKELTTENASLLDAWNSDYMKDIRSHFIENKRFSGCSECWRMQDMGLRSMRYDSYQYNTSEKQILNPKKPQRIELNSSNICNLKCRICYPNAANKWIKEYKDLYGKEEKVYYNLTAENVNDIKSWAENLEELCFFGGEPLLSKENFELMDYLIEKNLSKKTSLLFNTNGTVFNDKIAERLKQFKSVRMYFSIDDIGERFEYQRKGANWDEVNKNIEKAYLLSKSKEGKNIDFKICTTVSLFNIYYFPEFFNFFEKNYPGLKIFWNLLFDPWRLSIQILPEKIKEILEERLKNGIKPSYERTEAETKTVDELVIFLKEKVDKPFDEFFRYVNRHDIYRKENFTQIFGEFYALIKEYQPDYLNFGKIDEKDLHNRVEKLLSYILQSKYSQDEYTKTNIENAFLEINKLFYDTFSDLDLESRFSFFHRHKRMLKGYSITFDFFKSIMFENMAVSNNRLIDIFFTYLEKEALELDSFESIKDKLKYLREFVENDHENLLISDFLQTETRDFLEKVNDLSKKELSEIIEEKYRIKA
jgi:organic radical activating enzyme